MLRVLEWLASSVSLEKQVRVNDRGGGRMGWNQTSQLSSTSPSRALAQGKPTTASAPEAHEQLSQS